MRVALQPTALRFATGGGGALALDGNIDHGANDFLRGILSLWCGQVLIFGDVPRFSI